MQRFDLRRTAATFLIGVGALSSSTVPAQILNPLAGKTLRVILPVGAGSGIDTQMRAAAPALGRALNQPVVIENLPGAGGITGTLALIKAAPDGGTIAMVSNNHAVNPSIFKKIPYDSLNDITPITVIGETPFVLVINPDKVPARNAKELQAFLEAKPGVYNYSSPGNGTAPHLGGAMVVDAMGLDVRHIPYKGVGPQLADLIGGQVEMGVAAMPAVQGHLNSGALRAIGITGKTRAASMPDLPTMAEQGFPTIDMSGWFAIVGPAKMRPTDVNRIHEAVVTAFATPEVKEAMARQSNIIRPMNPLQSMIFFRAEQQRYAELVRKAGIAPVE